MHGTRLLITGGSGFMGVNAMAHFSRLGYDVRNLDVRPTPDPAFKGAWLRCDLLDAAATRATVEAFHPELVLHLAARTDLAETRNLSGYDANITGVRHLLEAVESTGGVRRLIVASSRMVCRLGYQPTHDEDYCPPNLYGQSKVETERIVRAAALSCEWLIVRPTSVWGPWFDVPYRLFFDSIRKGMYFHPAGVDPRKSFAFVGNSLFQLAKLFEASRDRIDRRTMYLCDYPPLHVREWAELIRAALDAPRIRSVPVPLLKIAALAGDAAYALGWYRAPLTSFRLTNLVSDMLYDTTPIEAICGPLPFSLAEGVQRTADWMLGRERATT